MTNSGGDELESHTVDKVLVGDVWVLAGQSNMVGRAELKNVEQPHELVHVFQPKGGGWARGEGAAP